MAGRPTTESSYDERPEADRLDQDVPAGASAHREYGDTPARQAEASDFDLADQAAPADADGDRSDVDPEDSVGRS